MLVIFFTDKFHSKNCEFRYCPALVLRLRLMLSLFLVLEFLFQIQTQNLLDLDLARCEMRDPNFAV